MIQSLASVVAGLGLPDAEMLRVRLGTGRFAGGDASAEARRHVQTTAAWPAREARFGPMETRAVAQGWRGVGVYGFGRDGTAQGSVVQAFIERALPDWTRAIGRMGAAMPSLPPPAEMHASPEAAAMLVRTVETVRAECAEVRHVEVVLDEVEEAHRVVPWRGASAARALACWRSQRAVLVVMVTLASGARGRARAAAGEAWRLDTAAAAREAVHRARHTAEAHPLTTGRTAVVLRPEAAAMWAHEAFGHRLEADAPGAFRISDFLLPGLVVRHTTPHPDAEAAPPHDAVLVRDGAIAALLGTARDAFADPTARLVRSARRMDVRHAPLARQHTLRLATDTPEAALAMPTGGLTRGLIVTHAAHAMIADGIVTLEGAAGWRIEGGQRARPFAGATLRMAADARVEALGADAPETPVPGTCVKAGQRVMVGTSAPSVQIVADVVRR